MICKCGTARSQRNEQNNKFVYCHSCGKCESLAPRKKVFSPEVEQQISDTLKMGKQLVKDFEEGDEDEEPPQYNAGYFYAVGDPCHYATGTPNFVVSRERLAIFNNKKAAEEFFREVHAEVGKMSVFMIATRLATPEEVILVEKEEEEEAAMREAEEEA